MSPNGGYRVHSDVESYCEDGGGEGVKGDGRYISGLDCYNGLALPEAAIKTEHDSDSENAGGSLYTMGHNGVWEKHRFTSSLYPEHHHHHHHNQVKTETDFYDHYTCQRSKSSSVVSGGGGSLSPSPINGHHKYFYAAAAAASRLPKSLLNNKDLTQFSPHRVVDPLCTIQGANCIDHVYVNGCTDHKGYNSSVSQEEKLEYEFRGHGLVQSIKREPIDSPPWSDSQDIGHSQRNMAANCSMNALAHKSNPYVYMQ